VNEEEGPIMEKYNSISDENSVNNGSTPFKEKRVSGIFPIYLISGLLLISMLLLLALFSARLAIVNVNKEPLESDIYTMSAAADDVGNIYIVWQDVDENNVNQNNIYIAKSTDKGKTFSGRVRVNDVDGEVPLDGEGTITASGDGSVCSAWLEYRDEGNIVFFDRSSDGGRTFDDDLNLFPGSGHMSNPSLAIDKENNVYAVFQQQNRIHFARLNHTGDSFSMQQQIIDLPVTYQDHRHPSIAVTDDGDIYVGWVNQYHSSNWGVFFAKSTDGGHTFRTQEIINGSDNDYLQIAFFGNNVYMAWTTTEPGKIAFSRSMDNGETWSKPVIIGQATPMMGGTISSMAVDSRGTIYIAWPENYGLDKNIKIAKSDDDGKNWIVSKNPGISPNDPRKVTIITDADDDVYVAWADGQEGDWNIHFSKIDPSSIEDEQLSLIKTLFAVLSLVLLILFIVYTATETGRYKFIRLLGTPFIHRIGKEEVLKHELRNALLEFIKSNPNIHFKLIKKEFKRGTGTLAYNLSVLERKNHIISRSKGLYRLFNPKSEELT
jgi:hypothetical protein